MFYFQEDSEPTDLPHSQDGNVGLQTPGDYGSSTSRSVTPSPIPSRPKRKKVLTPADEVIQLAGEQLKSLRPDDEFEAYGKYIAHKLRSFKGIQAIFARKLINDVIFEGELGTLNKDFKVMNTQPHLSFESDNQQFNLQLYSQQPYRQQPVSANVTRPNVQANNLQQTFLPPYTSQMADDQLSRSHTHIPHPQQHYPRSSSSYNYNTPPLCSQTRNPDTHEVSANRTLPSVQTNIPEQSYSEQPEAHQPISQQLNSQEPSNQSKDSNVSAFFSNFSA